MSDSIKDKIDSSFGKTKMVDVAEPASKLLREKLAYHERQIELHREEIKKLIKLMDMMEKYGMTEHSPGTVANPIREGRFYGGGLGYTIDDLKKREFWLDYIVDYVRKQNKLVRTVDVLESVKTGLSISIKRNIMSVLSLVMSDLCVEGKLKKYKVEGMKGYLFGTPEMFNGDVPIVEFR